MTRRDQLRRVALLCASFTQNLAYFRAIRPHLTESSPPFVKKVANNFLDMAVIEWCKLLGDKKGKHFWAKVVTDQSRFESAMLDELSMTADGLADYDKAMLTYRDKFLAHLDDLPVMDIPFLDRAKAGVEFYHRYVVQHEASSGDLAGLPDDLIDYYKLCFAAASAKHNTL